MKVASVVGTRPQFLKVCAVDRVLRERHEHRIIHTGQHFDDEMSMNFFKELEIPAPSVHLDVNPGDNAAQVAAMLPRLSEYLAAYPPDVVLVYGDTNSTLAGALAASYGGLPSAHVEAGLRSFDRRMAEELNRVIADHICDFLFAPDEHALAQLRGEGLVDRTVITGDVLGDLLAEAIGRASPPRYAPSSPFALLTLHRAETVDDPDRLAVLLDIVASSADLPIMFPVHPRTAKTLQTHGIQVPASIQLLPPVPYLEMIWLEAHATVVATDSGGVQREAAWLGRPCVVIRETTEWPSLIDGTRRFLARDDAQLRESLLVARNVTPDAPAVPRGASHRLATALEARFGT